MSVLDLRRMIDEHVPKERLDALAICEEFHLFWRLNLPYCGKWMSGVEFFRSEVKRRYRVSIRCERKTLRECMKLLHEIMAEVSGKPELSLHVPSSLEMVACNLESNVPQGGDDGW